MMEKAKPLTNKELILSAIKSIGELGYHVTDLNTTDTYFVFEGEDDSICHFHIKEIPGFLFAFWNINRLDTLDYQREHNLPLWCDYLDIDTKTELIFFTQYERDLDKFKPSRSGFVTGIFRQHWEESNSSGEIVQIDDWSNFYEIESILKYMKKHKIKSAEYANCQTRYIWEDDRSNLKFLVDYLMGWFYEYKYRLREHLKFKKAIKVSKKYMRKLKTFNYIIRDEGDCVHPRVDVSIRRKDNTDIDGVQYEKDWEIIDKFHDKYYSILSINWRQFDGDDPDVQELDKKERDWFFWFCDRNINNKIEDIEVIEYKVENVADLEEIKERIKIRQEEIDKKDFK